MKIRASEVLDQKVQRLRIIDHIDSGYLKRSYDIEQVKENAINFVDEILSEIELPGATSYAIGNLEGFEQPKPVEKIKGSVTVYAAFPGNSGINFRMDLRIPVYHGEFIRPSMVILNNKKMYFSKQAVENFIGDTVTKKPETNNLFSKDVIVTREENIEKRMFSAPDPPYGADMDLLLDRDGLSK